MKSVIVMCDKAAWVTSAEWVGGEGRNAKKVLARERVNGEKGGEGGWKTTRQILGLYSEITRYEAR